MELQSLGTVLVLTITIFANVSLAVFQPQRNSLQSTQQNLFEIQEDAVLTVPGLISKFGYPIEVHSVRTEDGYILSMHRIPHGKSGPSHGRPVVYILHGFLANSADAVLTGPENALGYYLADIGYDVWLGNTRGSRYSLRHANINPYDRKYWDYSWSDIAYYDIPAMIDYILAATQQQKLFYIGHSRGTTVFYAMCASRPEYNNKIRAMMSMAPVAYCSRMPGPIFQALSRLDFKILRILDTLGIYQYTPQRALLASAGQLFCSDGSPTQSFCAAGLYSLAGFDQKNYNTSILPIFFGQVPDSFAIKELAHFSQLIRTGKFRNFDYGTIGNLRIYNRTEPPDYDLSKVTAPVAIYCSENDWQSSAVDADQLYQELGNPIGKFVLAERPNHYSYFHGKNMRQILYSRMVEVMRRY